MESRSERIQHLQSCMGSFIQTMKAARRLHEEEQGLSRPQRELLFLLSQTAQMSVKEIATGLDITGSAATQLIDGLVHKGVLARTPDQQDRRIVHVHLSASAHAYADTWKKELLKRLEVIFQDVTNSELETLETISAKIAKRVVELHQHDY